jgi:hypothetical protein
MAKSRGPVKFPSLADLYRVKPQPKQGTGGDLEKLMRKIAPPHVNTRKRPK